MTIKLQVALETSFAVNDGTSSLSWTLMVFPDAPPIPAVGGVGLGIMVASLVAAGGGVISRRKGFARAA